jgi:hypothetical protein
MQLLNKPLLSRVWLYQNTLIAILFAGAIVQSEAQIYTITAPNNNSSVQVNLSGGSSGLSDWQIGGVDQLYKQWFYYSLDSGTVNSIDTIASPSSIVNHTTGLAPFVSSIYANSAISVSTKFSLNNAPTLQDTITVLNPSSSGQTHVFHFYQYSDFDLGGIPGSQNVQFYNNGSGSYYEVKQSGGAASLDVTVSASNLSEVQAGLYDGNQFGLGNGNSAPTLNNTFAAGPGNVDYAYEWDVTLAPGSSFQISELQTVTVPEPSPVALMASGLLALALLYRRRRADSVIAVLVRVKNFRP